MELNVVKNPSHYDEYRNSGLSEKYLKMAQEELRETDHIREESLQLMRRWIAKNPNIITCRTDARFLLRFLRVTKFSVRAACTKLERFLYVHQACPQYFGNLTIEDDKLQEIIDIGWIIPLPERDQFGRQVLFFRSKVIDPDRHTSANMMRAYELVMHSLYDDDAVQIAGIVFVFDDDDFSMGHVTMWSLTDIKEITSYLAKATPARFKLIVRVGLPTLARAAYDLTRSFMSDKVRQRFMILKDFSEVGKVVNPDILPQEYGGRVPTSVLIDALKKRLKEHQPVTSLQEQMKVERKQLEDEAKSFGIADGLVGSFRTLEVD